MSNKDCIHVNVCSEELFSSGCDTCKLYEPEQIYRFPHLHSFDGLLKGACLLKLEEEINEAKDAFYRSRVKGIDKLDDETVIELFDVIQVAETTLRNSGRTEEELLALMERHNAKDAARGYDKQRGE